MFSFQVGTDEAGFSESFDQDKIHYNKLYVAHCD